MCYWKSKIHALFNMGRRSNNRKGDVIALLSFFVPLVASSSLPTHTGLYTGTINEAEVTIPRKVAWNGEHISHNLTSFHNNEPVHFNVTISNKDHLLVLHAAKHFLAPGMIIERHRRDVHIRTKPKQGSTDCHYQGAVLGQPNSRVALSACNGLTGLIHTESGKYYIEPSHATNVNPGHKHLIYKRSSVSNHSKRKRKKKRRKHSKDCGTREPKRMSEIEWQKQVGKVTVQEKRHKHKEKISFPKMRDLNLKNHKYKNIKRHRHKRSISKPQFVEALLVADSTMVEFHEEGDVETYLLTIMNMVSSLYLDPSIGNLIKVVVVKIILIEDVQTLPELNVSVNADVTLPNFCKWQKSLNPVDDAHPHHHDVAILVTRKDICAGQNTPCNTLGVAHIGGMCRTDSSCSVNEDNGITLAHTITHEMGHNFGMHHDTDKIGCKRKEGRRLHVMTPSFEADTVEVTWSRCSRRDVTNFLDKGMAECLQDSPSEELEDYVYPELPAGAMYNAKYQCRLQFGSEAQVCTPVNEICSRLWCQVNGSCTTQLRPAAPGTHCGKHMWCQEQRCVPIMEPPIAIDGGWGEWGSWSECSRSCGAGISIMTRECDHPKPAAGGRFCTGERSRYRLCNPDPCPDNQPTFRAVQCSAFNNRTYHGKKYEWVPQFEQDEPCKLSCSDANDTVIATWSERALDGTPCNAVTRDICISGICKKVGCDWMVDSSAVEDACGICQGDGSTCDTIKGMYTKQSLGAGYREMIIIPAGSRNIRVEEIDRSENYISIGSATSRKFYLNGKRHIKLPGECIVAGAQSLYERDNELEKIRIPGPIQESILLYIIFRGKTFNPGIKYQFTMSKREPPKQVRYSWILGDWSQCTATCGGGVQSRGALCQESLISQDSSVIDGTSTIVDESLCEPADEPAQLMRTCKEEPCPSHWWIGPWQSCPVTCSKKGEKQYRRRSVMCVDGLEMALPDHYCSSSTKPKERDPCKGLPVCVEDR